MPVQNRRNSPASKNRSDSAPPPASEAVSPWKTPAGIAVIITAIAGLITAIASLLPVIPNPTAAATTPPAEAVLQDYCDGFFEGYVIEAQIGIPIEVDTNAEELITVKLMNNALLVGSLKFVSAISTVMIADSKCGELLKPTVIQVNLDNNFLFGDYSLTYRYDEQTKKLSLSALKR